MRNKALSNLSGGGKKAILRENKVISTLLT